MGKIYGSTFEVSYKVFLLCEGEKSVHFTVLNTLCATVWDNRKPWRCGNNLWWLDNIKIKYDSGNIFI